jgi:arylsulfatase A-like enzyme
MHINRRQFLGGVAGATLATGALAVGTRRLPPPIEPPPPPPSAPVWARSRGVRNVILIVVDSLRRDALGCMGGRWVRTPSIDAFAQSAVTCTNGFLCSFPTVLARHDILTGTYTSTYKWWSALDRDKLALQNVLHSAGLYSALVADTPFPYAPKFDYQRDFDYAQRIRGQESDEYVTAPVDVEFPCDPRKLRDPDHFFAQYLRNIAGRKIEEDYFCAKAARAAIEWLEKSYQRQPFFFLLDTFDPHEPWDPPQRYVDLYDRGYTGENVVCPRYDLWREFLTERELRHCRALYAAEATMADHWLGRFLERVTSLGLLENTLILLLSDHGVSLGEHGYIGKGIIRNHVLENYPLYPELCRIPFFAHYPGCKPGQKVEGLVQPVNVAATILDYLGLPIPSEFVGPSVWPMLQGKTAHVSDWVMSAPALSDKYMRIPRPTDRATITDGRWLLVYSCAGWADELNHHAHDARYKTKRITMFSKKPLRPELYNLQDDAECQREVYSAHKDLAVDFHRRFFSFLRASPMRRDHLEYFAKLENE